MTGHTIALVQEHYEDIKERIFPITETFYEVLFERWPEVRPLFKADLSTQYTHFAAALDLAVQNLGKFTAIDTTLQQLGVRHMHLGVQPQHYYAAREAFLIALERHSGEQWHGLLANAWSSALGGISAAMLRGAALETAAIADALGREEFEPAPLSSPAKS